MKRITLLILLAFLGAHGQALNPDLPVLLNEISKICGDRWNVSVGDGNHIYLSSKQKALGEAPGYNFGPGEEQYTLHFRFKVVEPVEAKAADQARSELRKLREQADKIEHRVAMGHYSYFPKDQQQWSAVVAVTKAETKVEDIPEYHFRSAYLSEEYSMDFFVPNKQDAKAAQYKREIEKLYALLEKTGS